MSCTSKVTGTPASGWLKSNSSQPSPFSRTTFELPAGEAFGERNPDMQQWVARKLMNELGDPDEKYSVGDVVQFPTPDGQGSYAGAVMQVREDGGVLFDFNHPLAGQPVTFEVQVIGIL